MPEENASIQTTYRTDARTTPRIRGSNPPGVLASDANDSIEVIRRTRRWCFGSLAIAVLVCITCIFGFLGDVFTSKILAVLIGVPAAGFSLYLHHNHNTRVEHFLADPIHRLLEFQNGAYIPKLFVLDAFNTEFTAPLADRSTLRITVHFQIPPSSPQFVEQLNRVTEAKLIPYIQPFVDPPNRLQIQDFLNEALVRFQDENQVAVLRVEVPIAIHIRPDKPRIVNV
jgi:hypothetical protein